MLRLQRLLRNIHLASLDRQKIMLGAGVLIAFLGILQFVVAPLNERRESLAQEIEANRLRLKDLENIGVAYKQANERYGVFNANMSKRGADFTLFAFLEGMAAKDQSKDKIEFMRPSSKAGNGVYQEEQVEMRLSKITLDKLVAFLYHVETAPEAVRVRRMSIQTSQPKNVVVDTVDLLFETHVPAPAQSPRTKK